MGHWWRLWMREILRVSELLIMVSSMTISWITFLVCQIKFTQISTASEAYHGSQKDLVLDASTVNKPRQSEPAEHGKESHTDPVNYKVEPHCETAKPTKKPHSQPAKVPEPQLSVKTSEVSEFFF